MVKTFNEGDLVRVKTTGQVGPIKQVNDKPNPAPLRFTPRYGVELDGKIRWFLETALETTKEEDTD